MDPTHVTPISIDDFRKRGWHAQAVSLFGQPEDSILALYRL
jgi:hypothetical protein